MPLVCLFRLSQVFLNNSLLLHALAALFFFAVLVPESVKKYIFDLASGVILSDYVQVLLSFVPTDCLHIVSREHFNRRLERSCVLFILQRVI